MADLAGQVPRELQGRLADYFQEGSGQPRLEYADAVKKHCALDGWTVCLESSIDDERTML